MFRKFNNLVVGQKKAAFLINRKLFDTITVHFGGDH